MKQRDIKILIVLVAIILVLGTFIIVTKGLNFELKYQDVQRIELNIGKEFDKEDIKKIVSEVLGTKSVLVEYIEVYKDAAGIVATEISHDEKNDIVNKVNEKYSTELKAENINIQNIAHVRGRDILRPYIMPFAISTIIILVYLMIRYYKLNIFRVLSEAIGIFVLAQLVLLGIMAITRMPIGVFTIPTVLLVYMLSTYVCTSLFEDKLKSNKED